MLSNLMARPVLRRGISLHEAPQTRAVHIPHVPQIEQKTVVTLLEGAPLFVRHSNRPRLAPVMSPLIESTTTPPTVRCSILIMASLSVV